MSAFTLDTSGEARTPTTPRNRPGLRWGDLDPFTQGYVEALFASEELRRALWDRYGLIPPLAFSDLAPETLATILKDCEAFRSFSRPPYDSDTSNCGRAFWLRRQAGVWNHPELYPPLTPYLGDDGKVYLREAA